MVSILRQVPNDSLIEIRQTANAERVESCDCMLVYLTGLTWTRGVDSTTFGGEVQQAMEKQVPLLLAHESTSHLLPSLLLRTYM